MVSLFRINDPFRILFAFGVLIVLRLPVLLAENHILLVEIEWLAIGEALWLGKKLYADVWTSTAPLSALVYTSVVALFGKSYLTLRIGAICLVVYQAYIFNRMMIRHDVYNEKTYLPAFLYVLAMNISSDFATLSPTLMALTCMLLGLQYIIRPDEQGRRDDLLLLGIYIGIATLFYLPSFFFLFFALLSLILFRSSSVRNLLLVSFGVGVVGAMAVIFFLFRETLPNFIEQFVVASFATPAFPYFERLTLLLQFAIPLLLGIVALVAVLRESAFVNFQVSCQQIMLLWSMAALAVGLLLSYGMPFEFSFLVAPLSFFMVHHLLNMRRKFVDAYLYVLIVVFAFLGATGVYMKENRWYWPVDASEMWADATLVEKYQNKRVLVLGDQKAYYLQNQQATPYFAWHLAESSFSENLRQYATLQRLSSAFADDLPELIVDLEGVMPKVFYHLPNLEGLYEPLENGHVYALKRSYGAEK